jgi:hypothetical protein
MTRTLFALASCLPFLASTSARGQVEDDSCDLFQTCESTALGSSTSGSNATGSTGASSGGTALTPAPGAPGSHPIVSSLSISPSGMTSYTYDTGFLSVSNSAATTGTIGTPGAFSSSTGDLEPSIFGSSLATGSQIVEDTNLLSLQPDTLGN